MYKIKIDLYDSNLITGSSDRLRQTIGGYYKIANIEDTPEMNRTLEFQDPAASDRDAYGETVADLPGTAMIEKILVAPYLAITASATSIFPYYVIPVSIMGIGPEKGPDELMDPADDAALLNSDEKWRSYILGGTFNTVDIPVYMLRELLTSTISLLNCRMICYTQRQSMKKITQPMKQ